MSTQATRSHTKVAFIALLAYAVIACLAIAVRPASHERAGVAIGGDRTTGASQPTPAVAPQPPVIAIPLRPVARRAARPPAPQPAPIAPAHGLQPTPEHAERDLVAADHQAAALELLDARFSQEPDDPEWTRNQRAITLALLDQFQLPAESLDQLACRATLCKLSIKVTRPTDLIALANHLRDENYPVEFTLAGSGAPHAVAFVAREGFEAQLATAITP